jgi:hypothetical protein
MLGTGEHVFHSEVPVWRGGIFIGLFFIVVAAWLQSNRLPFVA